MASGMNFGCKARFRSWMMCWVGTHTHESSSVQEGVILLALLGAISGGEALQLIHLPATSNVAENSPAETSVHKFSVKLSASLAPVVPGFPLIINSSPLTDAFRVNGLSDTDFEVVTTGKEQLDFETGPKIFDLQIYVKDEIGVTDLQVLTVQITDVNEPPQFPGKLAKGLNLYVAEGIKPGLIYQVEASDPEDTRRNVPLSYFLISPSKNFRMSANGTLFSTTELDFEAGHSSFHLIVEVRDSSGLRASTALQVNVVNINDEIPRFTSLTRVYKIPEELTVGTIVANITAEDPDDNIFPSHLLYSITTSNSYFMINQLTGTIQVAQRIDRDTGELRQNAAISLEVLVRDRPVGGQENRMQVTFIVEDVNDSPATCTKFTFSVLVPERAANGTLLLDLNPFCFDEDSDAPNNKFNFSAPSGAGSSSRFSQEPAGSGKIVLIGDLDCEDPRNLAAGNEYRMIIQVQDVVPPYYKNDIYIYILTRPENEFPLVFDRPFYIFNVSEMRPAGTRIGQVHATDADFPQSSVEYSISTGGASVQYPNVFWINPKTGELQLMMKADHETTSVYVLRIQATSSEDRSLVTVTVNILDENDEKPVCIPNSYFLAIPVDIKVGTNIQNFKLMCTDLDSSPRSFRYSIGPGNINSHFTLSPNAGSNVTRLLLASRFDYDGGLDKLWDYQLHIYITDDNLLSGRKRAGALVETGTVTLSVKVIPQPTTIIATTPREADAELEISLCYQPTYLAMAPCIKRALRVLQGVKTTTFMVPAIVRDNGYSSPWALPSNGRKPRITYQILKKNVYSSSAWYVPFVITLGSILLLGLLMFLVILLAKAIHTQCSWRMREDENPLVEKGGMKNSKREVVVETVLLDTVFDGEAVDPVTGKLYEFNSKTGARKWKDPLTQIPAGKGSSAWRVADGPGPQTGPEKGVLSDNGAVEDTGLPSQNVAAKPKHRNPALMSRVSPRPHLGN